MTKSGKKPPWAPYKKGGRMRIAAGTLMIIVGWGLLIAGVNALIDSIGFGIYDSYFAFDLFMAISAIFGIAGGVFCLRRKYWKVCIASNIPLLFFVILFMFTLNSLFGFVLFPLGILSLIFICLSRREWSESKA